MFEHIYAENRLKKSAALTSISDFAGHERLTFSEAIERKKKNGEISLRDPRSRLDPASIRKFAEMSNSELMARYGALAQSRQVSGLSREDRVRYAAVVKAGQDHFDMLRTGATGSLAKSTERQAMSLATAGPRDPAAKEMLMISAALSDKAQRERAMEGFSTKDGKGNIAKAAKQQGRPWLEVRDDLVKFGVLDQKDPRRKIRPADIDFQKGGKLLSRNTLSATDLESQAMKRLSKDPKDQQAVGWLATAGAIQGPKEAKKVKGTLPPKKSIFKRSLDIEL